MISLVIFTCEGREHLLQKTYESFKNNCGYAFKKVILAIDGQISTEAIDFVRPDIIVQSYNRKGYVHNIISALKQVDSSCFFWLEDDWKFHEPIVPGNFLEALKNNPDWAEIVFSKDGPLSDEAKKNKLPGENLYKNVHGFSANPCFCNTKIIRSTFQLLENAPKGDKLGEDGFENFLTRTFEQQNITCVIVDPVDHISISHEGYLESTPRNWHMTNSLESKTKEHLLTIPKPSLFRRLAMMVKLLIVFFKLSISQFADNKVYELCFRIIASSKTIKKDE